MFILTVDCGLLSPVCNVLYSGYLLVKMYIILLLLWTLSLPFHQGDSMELETWCLEMNEKWVILLFSFFFFFFTCDYNRLFNVLQSSLYCIVLSVNAITEQT